MHAAQVIQAYYHAFNEGDMEKFIAFLADDVVHDVNNGKQEVGKHHFRKFMEHMNRCYKEHVTDLVVFTTTDGDRAAAEFIVEGTYLVTDSGLSQAHGQHYRLPAGCFFRLKNNKISRVTLYYNLQDWLNQITS